MKYANWPAYPKPLKGASKIQVAQLSEVLRLIEQLAREAREQLKKGA